MSTRLAMAGKNNVYTAGQNFNGIKSGNIGTYSMLQLASYRQPDL